jgi:hypothetical protein
MSKLPDAISLTRPKIIAVVAQGAIAFAMTLAVVSTLLIRGTNVSDAVAWAVATFAASLTAYPTISVVRAAFGLGSAGRMFIVLAAAGAAAGGAVVAALNTMWR